MTKHGKSFGSSGMCPYWRGFCNSGVWIRGMLAIQEGFLCTDFIPPVTMIIGASKLSLKLIPLSSLTPPPSLTPLPFILLHTLPSYQFPSLPISPSSTLLLHSLPSSAHPPILTPPSHSLPFSLTHSPHSLPLPTLSFLHFSCSINHQADVLQKNVPVEHRLLLHWYVCGIEHSV